MNALGGRKFTLALLGSLASIALCAFGRLSGSEWVAAQTLVLALYKTANLYQQRIEGGRKDDDKP